jgi:hypothetical protein
MKRGETGSISAQFHRDILAIRGSTVSSPSSHRSRCSHRALPAPGGGGAPPAPALGGLVSRQRSLVRVQRPRRPRSRRSSPDGAATGFPCTWRPRRPRSRQSNPDRLPLRPVEVAPSMAEEQLPMEARPRPASPPATPLPLAMHAMK